jgi:hypothetical protein
MWPHEPEARDNVGWPTTTKPGLVWRALGPLRSAKRAILYRLRPLARRFRGVRGVRT